MAAAGYQNVDKSELTSDDLFLVKAALISMPTKWKHIGLALGIQQHALDTIQTVYPTDPGEAITQMVVKWLAQSYNVEKFGKPSWAALVKAVAHDAGGASKQKAEEIAREHPGQVEMPPERPPRRNTGPNTTDGVARAGSTSSQQGAFGAETGNPYDKAVSDMYQYDWFHGELSREDCEQRMKQMNCDCFLVRESASTTGQLTLSLKNDKGVRHFKIRRGKEWAEVDGTFKQFSSVPDLVVYYKTRSITTDSNDRLANLCPKPR